MAVVRSGDCNRCGQCCGASGSPQQKNPWPKSWPSSIRHWPMAAFESVWPHAALVGLAADPVDGTVTVVENSGNHNITGNKIYWIWISGSGLCRDLEPYGDLASYSLECPWLLSDPGDGTRPCALVGTRFEDYWSIACDQGPNQGGIPPYEFESQVQVDQWFFRHPLCSFQYTEA